MITVEQLLAQVDKTPTCWLWIGSRNPQGYGRVYIQRKTRGAHRLMYELLIGPIPEGLQIDHIRAEIDQVADTIIPMLIHGLYVRDMAGLDLTLLRTYLAAERGHNG